MNKEEFRAAVEQAISSCSDLLNNVDIIEEDSNDEMFEIAGDIHELKSVVSDLMSFYQDKVVGKVRYLKEPAQIKNGTIEIKKGSSRKSWDHEAMSTAVAQRIYQSSIDLDTGEVTKSPVEMMLEMMKYGAVSYWRATNLKDLHIDPDEYCEVSEGKTNLVIRRTS